MVLNYELRVMAGGTSLSYELAMNGILLAILQALTLRRENGKLYVVSIHCGANIFIICFSDYNCITYPCIRLKYLSLH
jgi:hypothetical protein